LWIGFGWFILGSVTCLCGCDNELLQPQNAGHIHDESSNHSCLKTFAMDLVNNRLIKLYEICLYELLGMKRYIFLMK
jgi:hypothetical protein